MSVVQAAVLGIIAVVLAILGTVVLLDRKFFRTQTPKKDSTIAKQEIV